MSQRPVGLRRENRVNLFGELGNMLPEENGEDKMVRER